MVQFCIVHRDIKNYNNLATGFPKVTSKSVTFISIQEFLCVRQRYSAFSPTDLIVSPEYFHFLNTEHLSLLRQEFEYVLRL